MIFFSLSVPVMSHCSKKALVPSQGHTFSLESERKLAPLLMLFMGGKKEGGGNMCICVQAKQDKNHAKKGGTHVLPCHAILSSTLKFEDPESINLSTCRCSP